MSNNNNENTTIEKNSIKMWLSLIAYAIIGLLLGYGVAKGALYIFNKPSTKAAIENIKENVSDATSGNVYATTSTSTTSTEAAAGYKTYTGKYSASFEGVNNGEISFQVNDKYTVDQGAGAKNRYFYVRDEKGVTIANIYVSFEAGRGYTPSDYITEVIGKAVKLTGANTEVIAGSNVFTSNTNGNSIWKTISSSDKKWVVVIESKVANQDKVKSVFETLMLK